jgi:hypothetical protein
MEKAVLLKLPESATTVAKTSGDVFRIVYAKGYIFAEGVHVEIAAAPYLC